MDTKAYASLTPMKEKTGDRPNDQETIEQYHNEPEPGSKTLTSPQKLLKLLKIRIKSFVFRILSLASIGLNVYAIYKKNERGHYLWVVLSILFLIVPVIFGSLYSMWCDAVEKIKASGKMMNQSNMTDSVDRKRGMAGKNNQQFISDTVRDFDDMIVTLDEDGEEDEEKNEIDDVTPQKQDKKKKKVSVTFSATATKKPKLRGTYIQPGIVDPKNDADTDTAYSTKECEKLALISWKEFSHHILDYSWYTLPLYLMFPKEYIFVINSFILQEYLRKAVNEEARSEIQSCGIKEVTYDMSWRQFCYKEIISKQVSLVITVFQSLPMILIDLLYWSVKSEGIANETKYSFFDVTSLVGGQFNILELFNLLLNIGHISYRLVSLMNQIRKFNILKQDLVLCHLIFLTVVYFLLLVSRVLSICLIACLNWSSFIMTLSILVVQFFTSNLISWNLYQNENKITVFISNLLMILLYAPPKYHNRISMIAYHSIVWIEMLLFFGFGQYQLVADPKIASHIFLVGQEVPVDCFYYGYLCSFLLLFIGVTLNSRWLSNILFKTRTLTREIIEDNIEEINNKHGTIYDIIPESYGQESELTLQRTIHLF